jgi:aryl-alcohol dehydrogenase-like predicted oxidoreductase
MNKIPLPGTGLEVSQICLGTNQFGTSMSDAASAAMLDAFVALGGNFIDTARSYGDWMPDAPRGASELAIGKWLAGGPRERVVLATKGCEFDYRAGFELRVTPEHLRSDLQASLQALGTDYIDLYWLHRDDAARPVRDILDALIAEQQAGRIRHFGCSNWSVARIREAQAYCASLGHSGFSACQPLWGLAQPDRATLTSFYPVGYYEDGYRELHAQGLTMIPYSAQCRGFFSKLARGEEAGMQQDIAALYLSDANRRKLPLLQQLALHHGVSLNSVVLAYLLCQPLPTLPIIGASSIAQLQESVAACDLQLGEDELQQLRDA